MGDLHGAAGEGVNAERGRGHGAGLVLDHLALSSGETWQERSHFAKRKIAIGDCMRAYGTSCVHEYACEQCKLARPDPHAQPRLQRTRDGLVEQHDEARQRGWLGEIERLEHILAAVDDKLAEIERARRRLATVEVPLRMSPTRSAT